MRILVAEDDFGSQNLMRELLLPYGDVDVAVNGREAVDAYFLAVEENDPYDLLVVDIMMPEKTGHEAIREIRQYEKSQNIHPKDEVRILMCTALEDPKNVVEAYYKGGATGYLTKPVDDGKLNEQMEQLGFIPLF